MIPGIKSLKTLMFFVFLLSSLVLTKKTRKITEVSKFDVVNSNKCYLGSASELFELLHATVTKFNDDVIEGDEDGQIKALIDLSADLAHLQTDRLDNKSQPSDALAIQDKYKEFILKRGVSNLLDNLIVSLDYDTEDFLIYIKDIITSLAPIVNDIATEQNRPFFFKKDFIRSISYTSKMNLLSAITDQSSCVPAKFLHDFDELSTDLNSETIILETFTTNSFQVGIKQLEEGRLFFAFWAKSSLSNLKKGNKTIFTFTNEDKVISLNLIESANGKSVDLIFSVGDDNIIIPNEATCSDLLQILFVINKSYDEYLATLIVRSTVLGSRQEVQVRIPIQYVEFATLVFPNSSLVSVNNISKVQLNSSKKIEFVFEVEVITQLTDEKIAQLQEIIQSQCESKPPTCIFYENTICTLCNELVLFNGECLEECPEGYYLDKEGECQKCDEKCKSCRRESECETCNENEFLFEDSCIPICPVSTYPKNGVCEPCAGDCEVCESEDKCKKCKLQFLVDDKCTENCPAGTYPEYNPNRCVPCCKKCKECKKEKSCTVCKDGLYLLENKCLKSCPNGTFPDENNVCQQCSENCKSCNDNKSCLICNDGTTLRGDICVFDCPEGSISNNGICVTCNSDCKVCLSQDTSICLKCKDGLVLKNTVCVEDCGPQMFVNQNGKCENCQLNCQICDSATSCKKCEIGFFSFLGECISLCPNGFVGTGNECVLCDPESNCKTCCKKDKTVCKLCFEGNVLLDGKCITQCPVGTYKDGKECKPCIQDCFSCTNGLTCDNCKDPSFIKDGVCVNDCGDGYTSSGSACHPCQISDCENCDGSETQCKKCKKPLLYVNGICVKFCPKGTFDSGNGECKTCTNNCSACISETSCNECYDPFLLLIDNTCFEICPNGTAQLNGKCLNCENPRCKSCNADLNTCNSCPENQYLYNNDCISECPEGTISTGLTCANCELPCTTCVESTTNCTDCITPFKIVDGACTNECELGQIKINDKCVNCSTDCQICTEENCIKCNDKKVLIDGECKDFCPVGTFNDNGVCVPCAENCESCKCSKNCIICKEDYSLFEGACYKDCLSGYASVKSDIGISCEKCNLNCSECSPDNSEICFVCDFGTLLLDGKCEFFCPPGYSVNKENKECFKCDVINCQKCNSGSDICDSCQDNKYLLNNTCVDDCPLGYRKNGYICEKCNVENCTDCSANADTCVTCDNSFVKISDTECSKTCPEGSFPDFSISSCSPCSLNCLVCTDGHSCNQCANGSFVNANNDCVTDCEIGYTGNPVNGKCEKCEENCAKCIATKSEVCEECKSGSYLLEGKCIEDCPKGTFNNELKRTCDPCKKACNACDSVDICNECSEGLILLEGKCIDNCPEFFVRQNDQCVACETGSDCFKCCPINPKRCVDCGTKILFDGKCIDKCPEGYRKLSNNTCEKCIDNCLSCSNSEACDVCVTPFVLKKNGKCFSKCCDGFVAIDGKCERCNDTNCDVCKPDRQCSVCKEGFLVKSTNGVTSCVQECGDGYFAEKNKCEKCKDLNCLKCTNKDDCSLCNNNLTLLNSSLCVTKCPDGKTPNEGFCVDCEAGCKKCCQKEGTKCLECDDLLILFEGNCINRCPEKYVFKEDSQSCEKCNDNCLICSEKDNKCKVCDKGFVVDLDGTCVSHCEEGTTEIEGKCEPCTLNNCSICTSAPDICLACISPYILNVNGDKCIEQCPPGQYFQNDKCNYCDNCPACADETGNCTECGFGYFLTADGTCSNECPLGQALVDSSCTDCQFKHCKVCPSENIESCNECIEGKILYNNECIDDCPVGTYNYDNIRCLGCPDNCKICLDGTTCLECDSPFVLQGDICQSKCNKGFTPIERICELCGDDVKCAKCSQEDKNSCFECKSGFALKGDKCVDDCGCGYFIDKSSKGELCKKCKEGCVYCNDSVTCIRCENPKILNGNDCVDSCLEGYVNVGSECKKCTNSLCLECSLNDQNICFVCKDGYFLKENECVENCGLGYYPTIFNKCLPCSDKNCLNCLSDILICTDCKDVFFVYDGQCVSNCPAGYVADASDVCKKCTVNNCKVCSTNQDTCTECQIGYLFENECLPVCPTGFFGQDRVCIPCTNNCVQCNSSNECTKCSEDSKMINGICISNCPPKTIKIDDKCVKCEIPDCLICEASLDSCSICITPKLYQDGKCVDDCEKGYYSVGTKCLSCEEHCDLCINDNKCNACQEGFFLFKEDCVEICPLFTFGDKADRKCKYCSDSEKCKSCSDENPDICLACNSGILYNGKCIDNCPDGTYYCVKDDACKVCPEGCELCSAKTNCNKCKTGLILFESQCIENCPIEYVKVNGTCEKCGLGCATCCKSDHNKCKTCIESLVFFNDRCVESCIEGSFLTTNSDGKIICRSCPDTCKECDSNRKCTLCDDGLVLLDGTCIDNCPVGKVEIDGVCIDCGGQNCDVCTKRNIDNCQKCAEGFFNNLGVCVENCLEGYFENIETMKCENCDNTCKTCDNPDGCRTCRDGLYFKEGTFDCETCDQSHIIIKDTCYSCKVDNCDKCGVDDHTCEVCSGSYVLIGTECKENCPDATFKVGQVCNPCSPNCLSCTAIDSCNKCENLKFILDGTCVEVCPVGYGVNDKNECIKCQVDNCTKCDGLNPDKCLECPSNFVLTKNICKEICPENTFKDGVNCSPCPNLCKSCEDSNTCIVCEDSYFVKNGICTNDCGDGFYLDVLSRECVICNTSNCQECSPDTCKNCNDGFYLLNNECVLDCPEGYFKDDNKCSHCITGCLVCSNTDSCIKCEDGLVIFENKCVTDCPLGYTKIGEKCEQCLDSNCEICSLGNPGTCEKCTSGFLIGSNCVSECPHGYYPDEIKKECVPCDIKCLNCTSTTCLDCNPGFDLVDGDCKNSCEAGEFRHEGECHKCDITNCKECIFIGNESKCLECSSGILTVDGLCSESCPSGQYIADGKCINCPSGCQECTSPDNCTVCKIYFFYLEGKCLSGCIDGTFANCGSPPLICEKCDDACTKCTGPTPNRCQECAYGYFLKDKSCIQIIHCKDGFFLTESQSECKPCEVPHCAKCTSALNCTDCEPHFDLKDGLCISNGAIETVYQGSVLQTPFSINYNEIHVIELKNYERLSRNANSISIITWIRDLGTRQTLASSDESIIYEYSVGSDISFKLIIQRPEDKCKVLTTIEGVNYTFESSLNCSVEALFDWKLIVLSVNQETIQKYRITLVVNGTQDESKLLTFDKGFDILDPSSKITLLTQETSSTLGSQLANVIVANYVINKETLVKLSENKPKNPKWNCNEDTGDCPGFIVLEKEFEDLNKEFKLLDNTKLNIYDSAYSSFGTSFFIYADNINESSFDLSSVAYPYENVSIKFTFALNLRVNSEIDEPRAKSNIIEIPAGIIKENRWYYIKTGISSNSNLVEYSLQIKDGTNGKEVLNFQDSVASDIGKTIKLFVDASATYGCSSVVGQVYNPIIFLGSDVPSPKFIIDIKGEDTNCISYGLNFNCISCEKYFTLLESGECVDDSENNQAHLFEVVTSYNQYEEVILIPDNLIGHEATILFSIRKTAHSINSSNNVIVHNLLKIGSEEKVETVLIEKVYQNFQSEFVFGDQTYSQSFCDIEFPLQNVVIKINKGSSKVDVFTKLYDQIYHTVTDISGDITKFVLFHSLGIEIQYEAIKGLIYPRGYSHKKIEELLSRTIADKDAVCIESDLEGNCLKCVNKNINSKKCASALYGLSFYQFFGSELVTSVKSTFDLKNELTNSVNSSNYALTIRFKVYSIPDIENEGSGNYNIVSLENDVHLSYEPTNPSVLMTALIEVKGGTPSLYFLVNYCNGFTKITIDKFELKYNEWNFLTMAINTTEKKFTYYISNSNFKQTDTVKIKGFVERLQNSGRIKIANSLITDAGSLPYYMETIHAYIIPNPPHDIFKLIGVLENGDKYQPKIPSDFENCKFNTYDPTVDKTVCLQCNTGYIMKNEKCQFVPKRTNGYQLLNDSTEIQRQKQSYRLTYPFDQDKFIFAIYFRINLFLENDSVSIFKTDELEYSLIINNQLAYISAGSTKLGPFDPIRFKHWNYVYVVQKVGKLKVCVKSCGTLDLSDDNCIKIVTTQSLPRHVKVDNSQFGIQVFGEQVLQFDYSIPAINFCEMHNCSAGCNACKDSICYSSNIDILSDGLLSYNFIPISSDEKVSFFSSSLLSNMKQLLRSDSYSMIFNYQIDFRANSDKIVELNLGDPYTYLRLVKTSSQDFELQFSNYITQETEGTFSKLALSLSVLPKNGKLSIIIGVNYNFKVSVMIYENANNLVYKTTQTQGSLSYLTNAAILNFSDLVSNFEFSYSNVLPKSLFIGFLDILSKPLQSSCIYNRDSEICSGCKSGYKLGDRTKQNRQACVLDTKYVESFSNSLTKIDDDNKQITFSGTSENRPERYQSLVYTSTIFSRIPLSDVKEYNLFSINSSNGKIIQVSVVDDNLVVDNLISEKSIIITGFVKEDKRNVRAIISVRFEFESGATQVNAYQYQNNESFTGESRGKAVEYNLQTLGDVIINYGNKEITNKFSLRYRSSDLYFNTEINQDNLINLLINEHFYSEDSDKHEFIISKDIIKSDFKLLDKLKGASCIEDNNTFKVSFDISDLSLLKEGDIISLITNVYRSSDLALTQIDILPDFILENSFLSIRVDNDNIKLFTKGKENKITFGLLPQKVESEAKLSNFKKLSADIAIDVALNRISIQVTADSLTRRMVITNKNLALETINSSTAVHYNKLSDTNKLSLSNHLINNNLEEENLEFDFNICQIDNPNCHSCEYANTNKLCTKCDKGFSFDTSMQCVVPLFNFQDIIPVK